MKKVVLMTGVLAAGLAAAPVTANAAAPSSPKIQEVNEVTPKDANDVYGSYKGQIMARFADIAALKDQIEKGLAPFEASSFVYTDSEGKKIEGWHDKAKEEALADLQDFDHELHDMIEVLEARWAECEAVINDSSRTEADKLLAISKFLDAVKTAQAVPGHPGEEVIISNIVTEDYVRNILPQKYHHLNEDWQIFTEYQNLGNAKWTDYLSFTMGADYKQVNETDDIKNEFDVAAKSKDFRLFYEGKHANRLNDDRGFCDTDCCVENIETIKGKYDKFCEEFENEKQRVADYMEARTKLSNSFEKAYDAFVEAAPITTTLGYPAAADDSEKATLALDAAKTAIETAAIKAEEFILTFNAQKGKNIKDEYKWEKEVPLYDGEGKNIDGKSGDDALLNLKNYKATATELINNVTTLIGKYNTLAKEVEDNRNNFETLYNHIVNDIEDWSRGKEKHHDADKFADADALNVHSDAPYYQSDKFKTAVPAAYQQALKAATEAYENFDLKTAAQVEAFKKGNPESVKTDYEKYVEIVTLANENETAHDKQHTTLDPLKETYTALMAKYTTLTDDSGVNDNDDHENISADDVNELYPANAAHGYSTGSKMAKVVVDDAWKALDKAYKKATYWTEMHYNDGFSKKCDFTLTGLYTTLDEKNTALKNALDAAVANEVAFVNGAHAYNKALEQAKSTLKEYSEHPNVYADWTAQISAILVKYPPLLTELIRHYDEDADAVEYVKAGGALETALNGLATEVTELVLRINENKRAYDRNNSAVDDTFHALDVVKAAYDSKKFETKAGTTETKDKDVYADVVKGTPATLKADFDAAWKAQYPAVKAAVEAAIGTTTSDFTLPAEATDFNHDIAFILSKIRSENGVDFNALHYAADADYQNNLKAINYIKDEVIPALTNKFAELVKANEDAYAEQLAIYNETAQQISYYECLGADGKVSSDKAADVKTAATSITDPAGHCTNEELAVANAKDNADAALLIYQTSLEAGYLDGASVKTDLSTQKADYESMLVLYNDVVAVAKANDSQFADDYQAIVKIGAPDDVAPRKNWKVNPLDDALIVDPDTDGWSYKANKDVTDKRADVVNAWDTYRKAIKKSWLEMTSTADAPTNAVLLSLYNTAIEKYNTAVTNAENNDNEYKAEIALLGTKVNLKVPARTDTPVATTELATMRNKLDDLLPEASKYETVKNKIVNDWEDENSVAKASANCAAIKKYQEAARQYNLLVAAIDAYCDVLDKVVAEQDKLDNAEVTAKVNDVDATKKITELPIVTTELNIDGSKKGWDKQRAEILGKKAAAQKLIDELKEAANDEAQAVYDLIVDATKNNERVYGSDPTFNPTAKVGAIDSAIDVFKTYAAEQQNAFDANERAFEPLHNNMKATLDKLVPTGTGIGKEAYESLIIPAYRKKLEGIIEDLEKAYLDENAVNFDRTRYTEIKAAVDYAYDLAKVAELGDMNSDHAVNEKDFMFILDEVILKGQKLVKDNPENKKADIDLSGLYTTNDLVLLNNYIWYKNLDGVQKAKANRAAFEAELSAEVIGNTVGVAINNNYEFNALQFDVTVPAGASLTDLIATTRAKGLIVASNMYADNTYRVVIVDMGGNKITGTEGNVISFNVRGAEGDVEISNVIAADGRAYELNGAALYIGQTTGIDEVAAEGETDIFSLDGIRQSVMKAGVNIVRGANGVAKKVFKK